ncbi:TIGR03560 family F420-dependent LLM class oxidoreductase [Actinokineospora enzanensis]|uniref:TIGR03560 family F420-dependent LLM class oxidoreductase n=1 Tax=Actinokineospora enzanensis TaxID=155975 RepID=UPI00037A5CCE|nr:TIGR03560 family F420-dependent LLM class oxidoreductase [Actinokineospora enzanensis]
MRISVFIPTFHGPGGDAGLGRRLAWIGRAAEKAGAAGIWLNDHLWQIPTFGDPTEPVPESYTALGFLAAVTEKLELGTLTTGATYRHPGLLLKIVSTLDALSGGRAWLGIGPPWHEEEQRAFGIPVPPWPERFARLTETLQLARQVWGGDMGAFHGEHYRLDGPVLRPPPVRPPPILIGGAHERRVLRLVARYGDACNLFEDGGPDLVRLKLDLLRKYCDEVGRDFDDITRTSFGRLELAGRADVETAVSRLRVLAGLGIDLAIVAPPDPLEPRWYALLESVVDTAAGFASVGRNVHV